MPDSTNSKKFGNWFKGSPVVESGDGRKFEKWWKGAPQLQSNIALNSYTVVASGGLTIGGSAAASVTTITYEYASSGGMSLGGAATASTHAIFGTDVKLLVCGTYIGDGSGARDLSICRYTPICVWVLGKIGGTEKGAFKTRSMPSTASQPWAERAPATSTTRITALIPNGFSVGSDLNSTGDAFLYIAWPDLPGVTAEGSYEGSGWSGVRPNTSMFTNSPVGQIAFADGNPFRTQDIGRTLYRTSDDAVIAVITGMVDGTHISATISITGFFAPNAYYLIPRIVPIGFESDLAILAASVDLGIFFGRLPVYLAPGLGLSQGDIPALLVGDSTTSIESFSGTGLNPSFAGLPDNDTNLYIAGLGTADSWDKEGVSYYWFAIKVDSARAANFGKIDYTGNDTERDIESVPFVPTLLAIFGQVNPPKIKAAGLEPTGTTYMLPFQDGAAPANESVTFISDGFHIVSSAFNTNTKLYRAFFLRPALVVSGLTIGGSAEVAFTNGSTGVTKYSVTASGGLTLGGAALVEAHVSNALVIIGSGGLTVDGAADLARSWAIESTGGLVLGGQADVFTNFPVLYVVTASGGLVLGGVADCSNIVVSGLTIGGAATVAFTAGVPSAGVGKGTLAGGERAFTPLAQFFRRRIFPPTTYLWCPVGGLTVGGTATIVLVSGPPSALEDGKTAWLRRLQKDDAVLQDMGVL